MVLHLRRQQRSEEGYVGKHSSRTLNTPDCPLQIVTAAHTLGFSLGTALLPETTSLRHLVKQSNQIALGEVNRLNASNTKDPVLMRGPLSLQKLFKNHYLMHKLQHICCKLDPQSMAGLSEEQHAVNRVFSHGEKIIIFMSCAAAAKESNGKCSICPAENKIFFLNFAPTARPISNTIHRLAEPLSSHLRVKAAVSAVTVISMPTWSLSNPVHCRLPF